MRPETLLPVYGGHPSAGASFGDGSGAYCCDIDSPLRTGAGDGGAANMSRGTARSEPWRYGAAGSAKSPKSAPMSRPSSAMLLRLGGRENCARAPCGRGP